MSAQETILSVRDLTVDFHVRGKQLRALRGIDLDLYANEAVAVVGESGSGKSVLTKCLCGMLENNGRISGGSILFEGEDLTKYKHPRQWKRLRGGKIAVVFQDPMTALNPILTIGKQITAVIRAHRKCPEAEARRRALEMMDKVGIPDAAAR